MIGRFQLKQCLWASSAPKAAPCGKEWICSFTQTNVKISFMQYVWHQHETAWDSFKNDSFQWFRVDSFFWETITLYTCTFIFKTLQDVFIHLEMCYTLHERLFSKIKNVSVFQLFCTKQHIYLCLTLQTGVSYHIILMYYLNYEHTGFSANSFTVISLQRLMNRMSRIFTENSFLPLWKIRIIKRKMHSMLLCLTFKIVLWWSLCLPLFWVVLMVRFV